MVWEDGKPKAYGAGLLSSCEEIEASYNNLYHLNHYFPL